MGKSFANLIIEFIKRAKLSVGRAAIQSGLPRQTLYNWKSGRIPRWHPELPADLARLARTLGLNDIETDQMLLAAGCVCAVDNPHHVTGVVGELELPTGWWRTGSHPELYDMGVDRNLQCNEMAVVTLRSREPTISGFGTLIQNCQARAFLKERLQLSATVSSENVVDWAGLWMRVDGEERFPSLKFDNMRNRAIKGTNVWSRYTVVLDVPEEAVELSYGIYLCGAGTVRVANFQIERVGTEVETTDLRYTDICPEMPVNLDFSNLPRALGREC
ncbi:MAG: hypothetical protein GY764_08130 [Halieaceae bacterium]|nr:hypothetical protein [Halieaceae bacterium]